MQHDSQNYPLYDEMGLTPTREEQTLDSSHALEQFLAGVERRALRMAEFATGSREDALDIVQEAMFKLVEKYSRRSEEEWGPLFYRVVQNRIHDWHRRTSVRDRFRVWFGSHDEEDRPDPLQAIADPGAQTPEQQLQSGRGMERLETALRTLPLRQQQVLLLRIWEGLDVKQTAQAMGCSEGSVKTHYSRAVHTLRQQLEGYRP